MSTTKFNKWLVQSEGIVGETLFERPRTKDIYVAPLVLIHHSKCFSSYLAQGTIAYKNKITGVVGSEYQEPSLKWLTAFINSPIASYYHFLTSTSWAVERGTVIHEEYKQMPFWIPNMNNPKFKEFLEHFEDLTKLVNQKNKFSTSAKSQIAFYEDAINAIIFELLDIHPIERQLIEDMHNYGIGFFQWAKQKKRKPQSAKPIQRPGEKMLQIYAEIFGRTATSLLQIKDKTLNATVYQNGAPLTAVTFDIVNLDEAQPAQVITQSEAMRQKLRELDNLLLEQKTPSMYMRRHVHIYEGNEISLVRPSEQRFWTQSQARADADAFLAELAL